MSTMALRYIARGCTASRLLFRSAPAIGGIRRLSSSEENKKILTNDVPAARAANEQSLSSDRFHGISESAFPPKVTDVLRGVIDPNDIEIKPDGAIYLPEIKYRRILNSAFGPGGWALMPSGETQHFKDDNDESAQVVIRDYTLYCLGRYTSQATGEYGFYNKGIFQYGRACESAKSNALVRCCKDLGIASELWDPKYASEWKEKYAMEVWCQNHKTKEKKKLWKRKDRPAPFVYPWMVID